jgi:hypothetical protein
LDRPETLALLRAKQSSRAVRARRSRLVEERECLLQVQLVGRRLIP